MHRSSVVVVGAVFSALLLVEGSCAPSRDVPPGVSVSDSAGVRIVELSREAWSDPPAVVLAPAPELSIGASAGSEAETLYRVMGAVLLEDGRIVILNGGSREVRFYGRDRSLLASQGRTGDGPGEYRQLSGIWRLPGDSVVVWDGRHQRVTIVGPDGVVVRETPVRARSRSASIRGALADGSLVFFQERSTEQARSMDQEFLGYYSRLSPAGDSLNPLGEFPWRRLITSPPAEAEGGIQLVEQGPPIFDSETEVAATADGLWVGTTKADEILRLSREGVVEQVLRWEGVDRDVTEEVKERFWEEWRERMAAANPQAPTREPPRGQPFAEVMPSHGELVARTDGGLWMQEFAVPGSGGVNAWRIFGPDALPEGRITLPPRARVLFADGSRVLVLERDDLDVEYVRLYSVGPPTDT